MAFLLNYQYLQQSALNNVKMENGSWKDIRVWWVPEFETNEVEIPSDKEEYEDDVPF